MKLSGHMVFDEWADGQWHFVTTRWDGDQLWISVDFGPWVLVKEGEGKP